MLNRLLKHRHETVDGDLQPRLPLEILYKIIDDHWETLRRDGGRFGLLCLSRTCKALESYCRPFLYRRLTVYRRERRHTLLATGLVTSPEVFVVLASRSPEVAALVLELQIILPSLPPKQGSRLKKILGIRPHPSLDAWKVLLSSNFSNVIKLDLVNSGQEVLTEPTRSSLTNAIRELKSLQSFVWTANCISADMVVRLSPRSLKHLSLLPRNGYVHPPPATSNPADVAHLESLRLSRVLNFRWWRSMFMNDGKKFDLSSLTHLQLSFRFFHNILSYTYALSVLTNLRCLHLGLAVLSGTIESHSLALLVHLKLVELVIPSGNSYEGLPSAFVWLERAFRYRTHTTASSFPPATHQIQVIILFQSNSDYYCDDDTWKDEYVCQVERWRSTFGGEKLAQLAELNLVIAGFSRRWWFGKAWALRERRPVWWERHWDPVIDDYKSRVTACSCSGWEGVLERSSVWSY
ncbi:hypothetical protein BKA70DRAFT_1315443 [Coprinopsis sp. MPI-PUGE-AT-0042]|nr:hypothetical protein BKA70DRAFT_1315443 [Coprinopsis sp. MPI-PUGE-AT-0042]